ncbi:MULTISPECIES: aminotransferase class V-fold PLP-dependent enzyme [unclassified Arthrobacter]|uniref:aminotransferase class V-fold PLP-dependent enzyme n=1 Tax=unclassified Arthrobacter TaxID=235627 RepID=UPI0015E351A1|nr:MULTISPECIES: aminotransferase class V-fold PLP-dependent enzyme [unclassified Arthrobacter]
MASSTADQFTSLDFAYFDHASIGTVPTPVRTAVDDVLRHLALGTRGFRAAEEIGAQAADLIAAEWSVKAHQIDLMASAGEALNAAARALSLPAGSRVLVEDEDFPQSVLPFESIPHIEVVRIPQTKPGCDRTEDFISALDPAISVVSLTHVHANTGATIDLDRLGSACAENGSYLVVDGSQAAGAIEVDASRADIYVATGYKWLLAGFGIAAVSRSERFDDNSAGRLRGYANLDAGLRTGHRNLAGAAALEAASKVRMAIGFRETYSQLQSMVHQLGTELRLIGLTNLTEGAGIISVGAANAEAIVTVLAEGNVVVAERAGRVRISPSFNTTSLQADQLIDAISGIASKTGILKGSFA